jgi:hypothetical protein
MAVRERNDKPGGAVCLNAIGRLWRDDSLGNPMIRGILQKNQKDPYALKASQNHLITRSISARLKEQGLTAGPEPARCALRCDRPKQPRMSLRASVGSTEASDGRLGRVGVVGPTRARSDWEA